MQCEGEGPGVWPQEVDFRPGVFVPKLPSGFVELGLLEGFAVKLLPLSIPAYSPFLSLVPFP